MPRRRQNHEGTEWFDKKAKKWRWRIAWDGKTYYAQGDTDRSRARARFDELLTELKQGRIDRGRQTLRVFLAYWLESVIRREVGETTYHDYKKRLEIYVTPTLGDYELRQLNGKLIRAWVNAVRDKWALSSARQALALLKRALDTAVQDGDLEENPARSVAAPKPAKSTLRQADDDEDSGRALSVEEMERVLAEARRCDKLFSSTYGARTSAAAVRGDGLFVLYTLAFRLGLRRGELLGLRWKDIDFDRRILRVRQQVVREDGRYYISSTLKTPAARRELPLDDDLINLLRELKLKLGPRAHVKGLVFPDKEGKERDPNSITRNFERLCNRLGIEGHHLHDVRATAITRWRERKVAAEVVAALAGHESANVSLETYTAVSLDRKRAALGS